MLRALEDLVDQTVSTAREYDQRYGLAERMSEGSSMLAQALGEARTGAQMMVADTLTDARKLDDRYHIAETAANAKDGAVEAAKRTTEVLRELGSMGADVVGMRAPASPPRSSAAADRRRQLAQVTPSVAFVSAAPKQGWPEGVMRAVWKEAGPLGLSFDHSTTETDRAPATVKVVKPGSLGAQLEPPIRQGYILVGVQDVVVAKLPAVRLQPAG